MSASIFFSLSAAFSVHGSHVWGGSTHTVLLNRMESKAFSLINPLPLTDRLDSLSHRCNVASLSIFYHYIHVDCSSELANYMCPSLPLTSIYTLSSLKLVNSGTLFLCLFFYLPVTCSWVILHKWNLFIVVEWLQSSAGCGSNRVSDRYHFILAA